jgi:hypothetical protein
LRLIHFFFCCYCLSYTKQTLLYTELTEKYFHLKQLYENEKETKQKFIDKNDEMSKKLIELKNEVTKTAIFEIKFHLFYYYSIIKIKLHQYKLKSIVTTNNDQNNKQNDKQESDDIVKIKKVQSLCRGWFYRRRWKRIVAEYIDSPYADNLRKRNQIVFQLVEKEEQYMSQLETLVANFLRPFKMAASSAKPPITHEEINCIFLNR